MFVDGQLKLERIGLRPQGGLIELDVELGPSDHFLTLVSTEGRNGLAWNWVVFGDPVLIMAPMAAEESQSVKGK